MAASRALWIACSLALAGCATQSAFQYAREVGSREALSKGTPGGEVHVTWRFGSPEWVNSICGGAAGTDPAVHGCAFNDPARGQCVVFLVEADDFQDKERLAVMGHELWHCLGARHA